MKITEIALIPFSYKSKMVRDAEGHTHPGGEHEAFQSIVRIATDDGAEGYAVGVGALPAGASVLPEPVKGVMLGEDPLNREC